MSKKKMIFILLMSCACIHMSYGMGYSSSALESYSYKSFSYTDNTRDLKDFSKTARCAYAQEVYNLADASLDEVCEYEYLGSKFTRKTLPTVSSSDYSDLVDMQKGVREIIKIKEIERTINNCTDLTLLNQSHVTKINNAFRVGRELLSAGALLFRMDVYDSKIQGALRRAKQVALESLKNKKMELKGLITKTQKMKRFR